MIIRRLTAATATALLAATPLPSAAQSPAGLAIPSSAPSGLFTGQRSERVLAVQILLDRARHSPGVIDGLMGANTRRAIRAYQEANGMPATGEIDARTLQGLSGAEPMLRRYTITAKDVEGPFHNVPAGMTGKADLGKITYESPAEALAEKFHMARSFLEALNPDADFGQPGTEILVVNAGGEQLAAQITRVEVDKNVNELRAYAADGTLAATYPTTVGSNVHPSPNTTLEVVAVAMDPTYHFDPEGRSWGPNQELTIAPGPNNPVGTVWIDLSRDGFGIHGTPEPSLIGKTNSHGCVRLTNWDAQELAKAIQKGATVHFV